METMIAAGDHSEERAWDDALERVRGYLNAHGVHPRLIGELAGQIVMIAKDRAAAGSDLKPPALAIECAIELIDSWVEHIVGSEPGETPERRLAHERASVHLARIPQQWPEFFLGAGEVPAELEAHLRSTHMMTGPDLISSKMARRPIDLGIVSEAAGSTWRTFDKLPALRAVTAWTIYVTLLALAFVAVRP